ncbi:ATP-grasp domain-containing protein [bacterium]|nr:ATP-grasp domain-containing protein [bacterium]
MKFKKIGISNRGEVAARIIRACQELGIEAVLFHSDVDKGTRAYRMADATEELGAAASSESYLNIDANIAAAIRSGVDAIHPGFGFLSENPDFAKACEQNGITFIGPSSEAIQLFGDKVSAKNLVESIDGPLIPGYKGEDQTLNRLIKEAEAIGFPVMVKAASGGGGRGLKVIRKPEESKEMIESAQREGLSAFGSSRVFLEKYIENAKHIEVQIFGDASGKVHSLFERECSVQRRHQKIIEEALSPSLSESLRAEVNQAAANIAKAAKYKGAGTVEFLFDNGKFYFMEMNTRLQVEHPVTEMVLGVDLVKAQILTAMDEPLLWWDDLRPRGHAIECRLYAEDPYMNGVPSTGLLGACSFPEGPFRRFEVGFEEGDEVTSNYDSMIAKVIVWDESRTRAIQKMERTLKDTVIFGVKTNIPLLLKILSHEEFIRGEMTTSFFDTHFSKGLKKTEWSESEKDLINQLGKLVSGENSGSSSISTKSPWTYNWSSKGGS